jgi:hypothetical protein
VAVTLNGTNQYFDIAQRIFGANFPFAVVYWGANVGSDTTGSDRTAVSVSKNTTDQWVRTGLSNGNTGKSMGARYNTDVGATKTTTPDFENSVWYLSIANFTSTTARSLYWGSSTESTDTATVTDQTADLNTTSIGVLQRNTSEKILYYKGSIAETHFYNRALDDTDYATLAGGALPETVSGWIDGFSLLTAGDLLSLGGTRTLTAYNAPTTSALPHPIARSTGFTLTADSGSYALTGISADLKVARKVVADVGAYSLTGVAANLIKATPGAFVITAEAGSYIWTGTDAYRDLAFNAEAGVYNFTGQDASFVLTEPTAYMITAGSGSYTWSGRSAALRWSGAPIVPSTSNGVSMSLRIGL